VHAQESAVTDMARLRRKYLYELNKPKINFRSQLYKQFALVAKYSVTESMEISVELRASFDYLSIDVVACMSPVFRAVASRQSAIIDKWRRFTA
jgi:hypothetical protein